jgi:hypothetical protein
MLSRLTLRPPTAANISGQKTTVPEHRDKAPLIDHPVRALSIGVNLWQISQRAWGLPGCNRRVVDPPM